MARPTLGFLECPFWEPDGGGSRGTALLRHVPIKPRLSASSAAISTFTTHPLYRTAPAGERAPGQRLRRAGAGSPRCPSALWTPAREGRLQVLDGHRLGDIAIHAGRQTFLGITLEGIGGHGDDGRPACRPALR